MKERLRGLLNARPIHGSRSIFQGMPVIQMENPGSKDIFSPFWRFMGNNVSCGVEWTIRSRCALVFYANLIKPKFSQFGSEF